MIKMCGGGMTPELEIILAEGAGLQPGYTTQKVIDKRNRCKLGQVALAGRYLPTSLIFRAGPGGTGRYIGTYLTHRQSWAWLLSKMFKCGH